MNIFNSGDLFCLLCGKTFSFEAALAQHLGSNHKKLKEVTTIHSKVPIWNKKQLTFYIETALCVQCYIKRKTYQAKFQRLTVLSVQYMLLLLPKQRKTSYQTLHAEDISEVKKKLYPYSKIQ